MKTIMKPDGYFLLEFEGAVRIFASWNGGYLEGDAWRLSSPAKLDYEEDETLHFLTASNTHYVLRKDSEGKVTSHNHRLLEQFLEAGAMIIREEKDESN